MSTPLALHFCPFMTSLSNFTFFPSLYTSCLHLRQRPFSLRLTSLDRPSLSTLINLQHTSHKNAQIKQHRANKHNRVPETKNIEPGSSRRNITRRHNTHYDSQHKKVKKQGGGGVGGKGQWNELDDGSLL